MLRKSDLHFLFYFSAGKYDGGGDNADADDNDNNSNNIIGNNDKLRLIISLQIFCYIFRLYTYRPQLLISPFLS